MAYTHNIVGWFEIPVADMERAIKFYESVLQIELTRAQMGPLDMAWFPWFENTTGSGGSLVHHPEHYKPSADGILIYLTTPTGDLNKDLENIKKAGGKIIEPRRKISDDHGYMAIFIDSEGNRVALHSRT
ncbi:MAG: VOC family protein [Bacteroidales bacterium]